ncbi:unnamed protein product [Rhizopus stolonifer]
MSLKIENESKIVKLNQKEFEKSRLYKCLDLACFANGSHIEAVTNNEFETAFRTIKPEPVRKVASQENSLKDGWTVVVKEDNDIQTFILKLGQRSSIYGFDIDTHHFAFERFSVSVEGAHYTTGNIQADMIEWITLLPQINLVSNGHNFFELQTYADYTHLRICGYSNGGIARFHAYGMSMNFLPPQTMTQIKSAKPLTTEAYAPYGDVIHPSGARRTTGANQGTANKFHHVAQVSNLFPQGDGKPNLCVFRCKPTQEFPFTVKLLERHPYSTQAFIPMTSGGTRGYLVVVALNGIDDRPDMSTLKAFIATSKQGVSYRQGVWHHPMIALDCVTEFAVLVHENGVPQDDCNEVDVPHVIINVPGFQANL